MRAAGGCPVGKVELRTGEGVFVCGVGVFVCGVGGCWGRGGELRVRGGWCRGVVVAAGGLPQR